MKVNEIDLKVFADHSFGGRQFAALLALSSFIMKLGPKPSVPNVDDGTDDDVLDFLAYNHMSLSWLEVAEKLTPVKIK